MSLATSSLSRPTTRTHLAPWLRVSAAVFAVAWGGNEFTPLLVTYRLEEHLSAVTVNVLLGAYVVGIVPALLIGGPLSDRYGRRALALPAPVLALVGSAVLAAGGGSTAQLFVGRVFSGLALGLVMAVGTAWIKELSLPPFDATADEGAGARRAALVLTIGFALGAAVAAGIAQSGTAPEVLPYVVNVGLCILSLALMWSAPETRRRATAPARLRDDLKIHAASHRRFVFVVAPLAPWVFGTAASAYAILPVLFSAQVRGAEVGFAGLLCLIALGCGVAAQSVVRSIDRAGSARTIVVSFATTAVGLALAAWASVTMLLPVAIVAAAALGTAYGFLLVTGLQEVQRIAGPDDLAGLTAVYYSLSYLGFFVPALLASLSPMIGYPILFAVGGALALVSLLATCAAHRRYGVLPISPRRTPPRRG